MTVVSVPYDFGLSRGTVGVSFFHRCLGEELQGHPEIMKLLLSLTSNWLDLLVVPGKNSYDLPRYFRMLVNFPLLIPSAPRILGCSRKLVNG